MKLSHSFSSIKMFENCPHRYYHQRIIKSVVDKGGEASMNGERIHKQLEDRIKDGTELPKELKDLEPTIQAINRLAAGGTLAAEQEYTLTEAFAPTGWFDKDAWFRSKLDVLVIRDDKAVVLDWKTGKRRPDFTQLELFALQVFKHHPEVQQVATSFIWIPEKKTDKEVYTRDKESDLVLNLVKRVQRIEAAAEADKWPAKPSGLCAYCPCKSFCDYAR